MTALLRIFKFALQNILRNIWLSLMTVTILILTLFSINLLVILNILTNTSVKSVEAKIDASIYFKPTIEAGEVKKIKDYFLSLSQVQEVKHISKEQALASFREKHKNDQDLNESLKEIGNNPLGDVLVIKAKKTSDYPFLLKTLDSSPYADLIVNKDFDDHQIIIQKINKIGGKVQVFGILLSLIFIAISVLIIFNTVKLAIYSRREEIGIMKLVGAGNWFARSPFLIEGIFFSLFSLILTAIIIYPLLGFMEPYLKSFFEGYSFSLVGYYNQYFWHVFGYQLLAVAILNLITSSLAVGKYLRV